MSIPSFYVPTLTMHDHPGDVQLSEEENRHARTVLRLGVGDLVSLFDGVGNSCPGIITQISKSKTVVQTKTLQRVVPRVGPELNIVTAMPRTHRQQFLFEKCTELGVTEITPIVSERSVVKPKAGNEDKWRRFTVEAAKQSGNLYLPVINASTSMAGYLKERSEEDSEVWLLDPGFESCPIIEKLQTMECSVKRIQAWIGPEGGFSDPEKDAVLSGGACRVSLGGSILRIETAVMSLAAVVAAWKSK